MTCCNSVNAQCMGMKPDRVFFSEAASVTASSNQVTITGAFSTTDVGKTLVLYNSVPTSFPATKIFDTYTDLTDLEANAPEEEGKICQTTDNGRFYMWSPYCGSGSWVALKQYQTKAVKIIKIIDSNTAETNYTFTTTLTDLDAVMGTDNFYTLQHIIYHCIDNHLDLCIPDGNYLLMFSDDYIDENDDTTNQRIRLAKGNSSHINIYGESKENSILFYEFENEISQPVYGMGIFNTDETSTHSAILNMLKIAGPGYQSKLQAFAINGIYDTVAGHNTAVSSYAISIANYGANIELNSVVIDGGENKCMSIAVSLVTSSPQNENIYERQLTINDSYITNFYAVAIYAGNRVVIANVADTTFYEIGLSQDESIMCTQRGATVYFEGQQNSYSFRNVTFNTCHRHAFQVTGGFDEYTKTYYQELINCKFLNAGGVQLTSHYDNPKVLGCEFNNSSVIAIASSCLIADTTFRNDTGAASGVALTLYSRSSYEDYDRFNLNIVNCRFLNVPAFTDNISTSVPRYVVTVDNCFFEGDTDNATQGGTTFTLIDKQELIVRDCHVTQGMIRFLYLSAASKAYLENNLLENIVSQHNIVIEGDDVELTLVNNRFLGGTNNPIRISDDGVTYTHGGQVAGYGNFITPQNEYNNEAAVATPAYFQKLLGRQGYFADTIASASFLSDVNFNFDFYKVSGTSTIEYIAFNNSSSMTATEIGIFCGIVRLLSLNGFTLSNSAGNIRTGSGSNYTAGANEVVELYYDADTQLWYMAR